MRTLLRSALLLTAIGLLAAPATAQWSCLYATYDDNADGNATGHNTPSVGVISEDTFVALVMNPNTRNFMVPYVNADSALGRLYGYGYGGTTSGIYQVWSDGGFDQVPMLNAAKIVATVDGVIYVANNDVAHNILAFKLANDTVDAFPPYYRQETGSDPIFGLAVDQNGYVYVAKERTTGQTDDIKVYSPIATWAPPYAAAPIRTIDLPDGVYRGIAVSPNGSQLFIADSTNRQILKFKGSPTTGYSADAAFAFQLSSSEIVPSSSLLPIPINMAYLSPNNILFVAVDVHGYSSGTHGTYDYGKIFLLDPFTGELAALDSSISVINVAQWNLFTAGSYSNRGDGTQPGNASCYTSTFDVAFDGNGNLYSQSHYGWTIEKWKYNGSLPVITPTGVETVEGELPESFSLAQNYPNPFNPSTTIEFTVLTSGNVKLAVYDVLGRHVQTLVDNVSEPGVFRVSFDARALPGGTYFYTLESAGRSITKKMTLVK